ncbi:MAG: M16 family metallopeptidase, partial [Rhodospirillaceae bacterium]
MPVRAAVVSMVLAGLALGFALAPPARAEIFNPETFTLDNGLQVVVLPNHRVPVVHHMVWYRVGAADEPPGKTGLSHLVEHMMFKGTETLGPNQFSRIVARNGGRDNAFASSDFTGYHQTIAKEHLEMVMGMEADRMVNLSLAEEDFLTELEVVREERRSRVDNEPSALLNERLDQALWVVHPYKNPIVGWEHELKSLTREDVLAFYKAHYGPENAIVVISGDVTAQEVQPLAEATYGQVPNQGIEPRMRDRSLPLPAEATITLQHAQVGQASLTRRYVAPSYNLDPEQDVYALQVFQEIVGSGSTGKLYRSLVIDQEIAVSAGAY